MTPRAAAPADRAAAVTRLCVFCSASTAIDNRYLGLAAEVGHGVGVRRWSLVSGGGSISMMGEVTKAARAAGSRTLGVLPRGVFGTEVVDHDSDELTYASSMSERKHMMSQAADAFLVLPGGIGTLEELLEVWVGRALGAHDKPVVVLDPWGDLGALRQLSTGMVASGFAHASAIDEVVWTVRIGDAFAEVERQLATPRPLHPADVDVALEGD